MIQQVTYMDGTVAINMLNMWKGAIRDLPIDEGGNPSARACAISIYNRTHDTSINFRLLSVSDMAG